MAGLRVVASSSLVCMTGIARVGAMVGAMAGAKAKGDDRVLSIIDRELRWADRRGRGISGEPAEVDR